MKRFLTPQEKKLLRYEKDRRNTVAESRARSRKGIANRKARAKRSLRRAQTMATAASLAVLDEADPVIRKTGKNFWRKIPDAPLADYVGRTLRFRAIKSMRAPAQVFVLLRHARRKLAPRPKLYKRTLPDDRDCVPVRLA